jgi:hypothetical protein
MADCSLEIYTEEEIDGIYTRVHHGNGETTDINLTQNMNMISQTIPYDTVTDPNEVIVLQDDQQAPKTADLQNEFTLTHSKFKDKIPSLNFTTLGQNKK